MKKTPALERTVSRDPLVETVDGLPDETIRREIAKDARMDLRLPQVEKESIMKAANACNVTATDFMIRCALLVARRIESDRT